jgi:broad specificity phosphatase PhoE
MAQLLLVRHGQASFGSHDYDRLSTLGITQSDLLGRWFEQCATPIDRVVAGAMRRHRETATHCLAACKTEGIPGIEALEIDAQFNEFDHAQVMDVYRATLEVPAASGPDTTVVTPAATLSSAELQRIFALAMARWMRGEHDSDYDESWSHFRARCIASFESLTDGSNPARTVVVFSSGGVIAAICQHLLGLTHTATHELNWSLANTGVTRVLFSKGRRGLSYLNNTAHFDWAREPDWLTYR